MVRLGVARQTKARSNEVPRPPHRGTSHFRDASSEFASASTLRPLMVLDPRNCAVCGKPFTPRRRDQKVGSASDPVHADCARAWHITLVRNRQLDRRIPFNPEVQTCPWCGETWTPPTRRRVWHTDRCRMGLTRRGLGPDGKRRT